MSVKDPQILHFELGDELKPLNNLKELRLSGQPLGNLSRYSISI
jgi:hypothetical protein